MLIFHWFYKHSGRSSCFGECPRKALKYPPLLRQKNGPKWPVFESAYAVNWPPAKMKKFSEIIDSGTTFLMVNAERGSTLYARIDVVRTYSNSVGFGKVQALIDSGSERPSGQQNCKWIIRFGDL